MRRGSRIAVARDHEGQPAHELSVPHADRRPDLEGSAHNGIDHRNARRFAVADDLQASRRRERIGHLIADS